ncbi:LysR family transcriptional regulator [Haematobacter missouriensis]|uniref:Transcriptional regulator n=1 Tax=Haematobacter missouriensis TaxID=366616 RepID=A0A225D7R4_9RHOB|nr:LysR family transcriptional regulator [Haematobacter missouriensis]OWJ77801.1 transcriptional regulator [Haematobacter missouriensis]OWJ81207.1 transcriptional regulator [Haematobacter missouriensis]
MRFTFSQLAYFVATAEMGSTSRASEKLRISQPAISVAIKQLEETFGQKLFVRRHARGVDLTPFGQRKLAEVRQLLAHAHAVEDARGDTVTGDLEIGVFSTMAPVYAPGILRAFAEAYPNVHVRMRELHLDRLNRDLEDGLIELALLYDLDIAGELTRVPLVSLRPYALLPEGHKLAQAETVSLKDLAREPFVLIDLPHSRDYFLSLFRVADTMPENLLRCVSFETLRGMVANGLGVSILVTRPYGDHSYDGQPLVCRPIKEKLPPQRLIIATSPRMPATPAAKAFHAVAQRYFEMFVSEDGTIVSV